MPHKKRYMSQVMHGTISSTPGGLGKENIKTINKNGVKHYVSKKKSKQAEKNFGGWNKAVAKARKNLGLENQFVLLRKSSKLYKEAAKIYYD